jgi:hypothetical protein
MWCSPVTPGKNQHSPLGGLITPQKRKKARKKERKKENQNNKQ